MGKQLSFSRLQTVIERQYPPRFGSEYLPSMMATRSEAPSDSKPSRLRSKLLGRKIHVMSPHEKVAVLLALRHPNLLDLHEQKIMWPWAEPHPLVGMPGLDTTGLPAIRGTIDVCERLGYTDIHPSITIDDPESKGKVKAPSPFLSDILLFLKDRNKVYCINWSIKDKQDNFTKPPPGKRVASSDKDIRKAIARHEIETEYHNDAAIRTHHIAGEDFDFHVAANLNLLFPYTYQTLSIKPDQRRHIVQAYQAAMDFELPPNEVMATLEYRGLCNEFEARCILYQAIWDGDLRVDFFEPILPDYPLVPEENNILETYGEWFQP